MGHQSSPCFHTQALFTSFFILPDAAAMASVAPALQHPKYICLPHTGHLDGIFGSKLRLLRMSCRWSPVFTEVNGSFTFGFTTGLILLYMVMTCSLAMTLRDIRQSPCPFLSPSCSDEQLVVWLAVTPLFHASVSPSVSKRKPKLIMHLPLLYEVLWYRDLKYNIRANIDLQLPLPRPDLFGAYLWQHSH